MATELPKGLTLDIANAWFGTKTKDRFNPEGAIGKAWLGLGCFPELMEIEDIGGAEYRRFADGTIFRGSTLVAAAASGLPEGVGADLVAQWYGEAREGGRTYRFAPDHPVGRLWLGLGRFPRLEWVGSFDVRLYFRFADGTVIYRPSADTSGYRVMGANTTGGLYPDGMDQDLAELWFGSKFNPAGAVSNLWLRTGQQRNRFPTYLGDEQLPTGQFFRFADGTVFVRAQPGANPTLFPPSVAKPIEAIWGGVAAPLTQGFGQTDFALSADGAQFYGYTLVYCTTWCEPRTSPPDACGAGHPGLDIGVGFGTALFTPVAGTVICAGTGISVDPAQEGCAAFMCVPDSGNAKSGRFELELVGGDRLIYGHLSTVTVEPGQKLEAGDQIGFSGRDNGDHVHIEYRQAFPECTAENKYLFVDPQEKFGKLP
jgi:murein DD-endopeptidase MepM/ murein hydrolase activator NlpD